MSLHCLVTVTLFFILPTAGQTDRTGINLVDEFKHSRPFFKQIEVGKQIIALRDPGLLENLKDMLVSDDRHVRANTAFVFAGLGDVQSLQIIANILQDRSDRPEGQGIPIAPGDGKYHVEAQIQADRYYAVHLLGELKDSRAIPVLIPYRHNWIDTGASGSIHCQTATEEAHVMLSLRINGKMYSVDVEPETPLLWVIRDTIGLTGTKYGCGIAQCGACTVHVNGKAVRSCMQPVSQAAGKDVTTIEGLSPNAQHPLQVAWREGDVPECGYCQPGQIMAAAALLAKNSKPTDADITREITNLCRCGTYPRIRQAIHRAAELAKS